MTGIISEWRPGAKQGKIHADDGRHMTFSGDAVWPYDLKKLEPGQKVQFDLHPGRKLKAVDVHASLPEPLISSMKTSATAGHLQYEGFSHNQNVREYRFRRLVTGQSPEHFVVCADLGLMARHGMTLQEGPALCESCLALLLTTAAGAAAVSGSYLLTAADLQAHLLKRRPAVEFGARRGGRQPARAATTA